MRLTLIFVLIAAQCFGQTISSNTRADIHEIRTTVSKNNERVSDELRARFAINEIRGEEYVSFIATVGSDYNSNLITEPNVIIGSQIKNIVSIKYPLAHLGNILNESQFESLEIAGKVKPMLNRVPIGTRADSVWAGYGLPQGYSGKDVIIGVTDWGFDYTSPMFYDTLLQDSRILAAWDQFKTSGPAPSGYNYGTEYATPSDLLNAGSDTANIYSYGTHGNHVAGIAGGSGAGTEYRGISFECNYLFATFLVDEASVLDAWEWMYDKAQAAGKRLVINMSWGLYHFDAIDGTSPLSQAIDAYSDLDVIFVTSAGNNGGVNFHLKKDFANDTLISKIDFYSSASLTTLWGQSIHMWGEAGNTFSGGLRIYNNSNQLLIESPLYSTATTTTYIDSFLVANGTDTIWYNLSADTAFPSNGRPQIRMRVKSPPSGYKVAMYSSSQTGRVHYWNVTELTSDVGNWGMPFTYFGVGTAAGDNQYGIGAPACTGSAISIGAYSSEYYIPSGLLVGGAQASFSSFGPLMNDSLKPDVSAPGVSVGSSISSFTDASFSTIASVDFNGRTYPFARFSGTSMSSPATAGVVGLILDANPYLSSGQVKEIIIQTARQDDHTGIIPPHSAKWGWGKVNAYAAVKLALNTVGTGELTQDLTWNVFPNPATSTLMIATPTEEFGIQIIDILGNIVMTKLSSNTLISIDELSSGTYFVRFENQGKIEQRKFVKH